MILKCPNCQSESIKTRNIARKAGVLTPTES